MVNTEIRLIILFAAKNGEALYSQQKQEQAFHRRGNPNGQQTYKKKVDSIINQGITK